MVFTFLTFLAIAEATFALPLHTFSHPKFPRHCKTIPPEVPPNEIDPHLWSKLCLSAALVVLGGVFSGLTLGLMGLDQLHLRVLAESSSSPRQRRNAQKVLQLMKKGRHWVLLLSNVIVNETLPIFLDSAVGGGVAAIAISTTAIVIFGCVPVTSITPDSVANFPICVISYREIIPQAISVRYGLAIGAACADFVLGLMWIMAPIAYPIARLLDHILGVHKSHTYRKAELKSLLQFHKTGEEPLMEEEISILNSVLELSTKNVKSLMTPLKDVVTLSADTILDDKKLDELLTTGYSRFPVHAPGEPLTFIGLLLVKKLLRYDPTQQLPVSSFASSILPEAHPTVNCFQALDYFQTGRAHLLLISNTPGRPGGAIGVVTLEGGISTIPLTAVDHN
uniref:CNNM transmembrane domain-containing protein n=1 Tax=Moniliophthora roreri TaxID=221103 RepID=A0A0W0F7R1_MONRR